MDITHVRGRMQSRETCNSNATWSQTQCGSKNIEAMLFVGAGTRAARRLGDKVGSRTPRPSFLFGAGALEQHSGGGEAKPGVAAKGMPGPQA